MSKEKIPEGWERIKLKEVLQEVNERNKDEKVKRVLSVTNSQGFVNQKEYFEGTVHSENISNYKIVRKNQFAYNPSRVNVGSIDILEKYDEGALSPMYVVFKVDETRLHPEYFKYYFETYIFSENVKNNTQGSVRNSLNFGSLQDFEYLLPSIKEQEKIVKILKNIDLIIEGHKVLLSNKKKLIDFWFDELFENKNFEKTTLNCVSEIKGEYGLNASAKEYEEELTRFVRITDINEDGTLNNDNIKSPDISKDQINKYLLKDGDIIFARTGATVGKTYKYDARDGRCCFAGYCIRYRLKKEIINPTYFFAFTKTRKYLEWIKNKQRGGAQPNINSNEYGNELEFPLPPLDLQNEFVEMIEIFEKEKHKLEMLIENYKLLKKGMMQKLLNGKVMVNV